MAIHKDSRRVLLAACARTASHKGTPLDLDSLFAQKYDQPADRESGHEVVAAGNSFAKAQHGIAFKCACIAQDVVGTDVGLDFAIDQGTKRDIGGLDG